MSNEILLKTKNEFNFPELNLKSSESILLFGQKTSEDISKTSDNILQSMKSIDQSELTEMLDQINKLISKFDITELEVSNEELNLFARLKRKIQLSSDKLFRKYDNLGKEIENLYLILSKYENDIKKTNEFLELQYKANRKYHEELERFIEAGEHYLTSLDEERRYVESDQELSDGERYLETQRLDLTKELLSQRVYDLRTAEQVALQACPMIQSMRLSNFNLLRKINSSFVVTLPIFKQCLIQAIQLKRQEIQAKSLNDLDAKTNELLLKNANLTATQTTNIARLTGGSSIQIETLRQSYETIKKGIEETRALATKLMEERANNTQELKALKEELRDSNIFRGNVYSK